MSATTGSDRAPWADDTPAVIPPGVKVTQCPPAVLPSGRPAAPPDAPKWDADRDGDFFSDSAVER